MTPFLFESSGDSDDLKSNVHHDHEEEVIMHESEGVSFRFDDENEVDVVDDDDDAQSCSYDHSSYISIRYEDSQHDQSQRHIFDDEDGNIHDHDDDDDDVDDSMVIDSSKRQKRSNKFCVDSVDQRENDRKFWEACLAT